IAEITLAWAHVEHALAQLLDKMIKHPPDFLAYAIFFTPTNLETRIGIVDAVFRQVVFEHPYAPDILKRWGALLNTLTRLKRTRNKVAPARSLRSRELASVDRYA